MGLHDTALSNSTAHNLEPDFSEHARKIIAYSREFREESPAASPAFCMTMAAGKLTGECGDDSGQLASFAMKEIAAKWVFG